MKRTKVLLQIGKLLSMTLLAFFSMLFYCCKGKEVRDKHSCSNNVQFIRGIEATRGITRYDKKLLVMDSSNLTEFLSFRR